MGSFHQMELNVGSLSTVLVLKVMTVTEKVNWPIFMTGPVLVLWLYLIHYCHGCGSNFILKDIETEKQYV